jgi:hypothetical protein
MKRFFLENKLGCFRKECLDDKKSGERISQEAASEDFFAEEELRNLL